MLYKVHLDRLARAQASPQQRILGHSALRLPWLGGLECDGSPGILCSRPTLVGQLDLKLKPTFLQRIFMSVVCSVFPGSKVIKKMLYELWE